MQELGCECGGVLSDSDTPLRNNILKRFKSAVLCVDLVGSTRLA